MTASRRSTCFPAHPSSKIRPARAEHAVDLRHHGCALADRRADPFGRASADVTDREYARYAGLQRLWRTRVVWTCKAIAGDDKAFVVDSETILQPTGIRVGTNKQEQMAQRHGLGFPTGAVAERGAGQARGAVAFERGDLGAGVQFD